MFHLFREELDDVFRMDGKLVWKLLAAVVVGLLLGLKLTGPFWSGSKEGGYPSSRLEAVCTIGGTVAVTTIAVLMLSLRDVVKYRMVEGKPISLPLRLYLGGGIMSVLTWIVTIIVGVLLYATLPV